jgi:hypothetical protein
LILDELKTVVRGMGYEVIDEQKSQDAGSGLVRVHLERQSPDTTFEATYVYVITYYIDRALTDSQREELMRKFLEKLRYRIDIHKNNFGSEVRLGFSGASLIDINDRIEGYKINYNFTLKI